MRFQSRDRFFHLFFYDYDNDVTGSSYFLTELLDKTWEMSYDVQLDCDNNFFCGCEFDNEYGWLCSEWYDKEDIEDISNKQRCMNSL